MRRHIVRTALLLVFVGFRGNGLAAHMRAVVLVGGTCLAATACA
jgi:hypothetical protein